MIKFQYWRTFKKFYGKVWCKILKCSNDNEQSNMCSLATSSDYFYTNIKTTSEEWITHIMVI